MSSISITHPIRLSSICAAALLLSCCAGSSASAREPKQASDVVELELRESGETARTHQFVVPLDGRIAGWTELWGERHYCQLSSEPLPDARVRLWLRCGKHSDFQQLAFDFKVEATLAAGESTVLAELTPRSNERVKVVATRR